MKAMICIILFGSMVVPAFSGRITSPQGNRNPKSICILSYNIRLNTPADGINAWPLRSEKVIGLLKFHKADIFGIQEALPEQVKDIENGLSDFEWIGVGRDDGRSAGEHMAIFFRKSRFEKGESGTFWLSTIPDRPGLGWDAACNRTCTWVTLKDRITKKSLFVFNTHFDHRGKEARVESSRLVLQFMKRINNTALPVILTGDFNSTAEDEPVQLILKELADSRIVSESEPYGPEGTSGGFDVKEMKRIIDFIFVSDKVRVIRHGILTDSSGMFYPSDHLPVLAEVSIK